MSDFDIKKARVFLDTREQKHQAKLDKRFSKAWQDFEAIINMIRRDYPVTCIYQWGSLLNRNSFSENSDIDIAVEGDLPAPVFFEMYGKAMEMTNFSIDIVELNKIDTIHVRSIKSRGKCIFSKDKKE